jgi:hypothetical protein
VGSSNIEVNDGEYVFVTVYGDASFAQAQSSTVNVNLVCNFNQALHYVRVLWSHLEDLYRLKPIDYVSSCRWCTRIPGWRTEKKDHRWESRVRRRVSLRKGGQE